MTTADVIDITTQAIWLIINCSAPMLLTSLVIGLIISIFQTVTSIQEQTLTFVPKILSVFLVLIKPQIMRNSTLIANPISNLFPKSNLAYCSTM